MKKLLNLITKYRCVVAYATVAISLLSSPSVANPIISGISSNEINIDTQFNGTKILLFGAKRDAGDIIIAVRGPKKDFIVTKKQKFKPLQSSPRPRGPHHSRLRDARNAYLCL